ncbi:TonB-dependent receptor plug domain-containing protein [Pseudomonas gingeri]|uniref:TonB-dependent receptor plug domain-containing protein n=1 Tax=Pseudomonas gingeri TaxID=117681 RepID=UPI0015A11033|nr:TonB-dependent receptor [Pseudomonas gingeri]NWA03340.1 TonB-dependent receptor [Pseudomonas gingeri]NWA14197.1 TonB-dependent receptor [Pseudomonas gingeri]NWA55185.1 TonB-dependent receptor [Pseudomonas gingeri]NWA94909.1 TonB-dependent receptor [Pseudomonas gingeri]NWB01565.1 TonB-dependent receptor [Pseudomonas gingeri]
MFRRTPLAGAIALVMGSLAVPVFAADDNQPTAKNDHLDTVVVLGTRRSDLTALQSAAPVDVLSGEQLQQTGATDLSGALTALSPSFNFPQSPQGAFAGSIAQGASLRGLASDQVLVLVNGKRRHSSANITRQSLVNGRGAAAVDLSLIPLSAIQRVEILRDGAAAQYGSDAIAGVINIVLKENDDGGNLGYRYGGYDKGDGIQRKLSGWKGFTLPNDGFLTLSFDAGSQDPASDTNPDNRIFYPGDTSVNTPREQNNRYRTWRWGSGNISDQYNFVANSEIGVGESLTAYGFATYSHKNTDAEGFFDPPTALRNNYGSTALQRYPDGRLPITRYGLEDYAVTGGLRFENERLGKFDLALNHGDNTLKSTDRNAINPSYGVDSPSKIYTGERENDQTNLTLDWVRDFPTDLLFKPLTLSAGLAWRKENYQLSAGEAAGWQNGPLFNTVDPITGRRIPGYYSGITQVDAASLDRKVLGAYIDVEGQITEKFQAGVAVRTEHYSDFGDTTNGKLSLRYDFTPQIAARATASTGYRAPSLVQSGMSSFSVQVVEQPPGSGNYVEVQQRTLRANSPEAQALGGKALKPEESTNYSLGLVWRPVDNASVTVDAYRINIDNRITLSDQLPASVVTPIFAGTPYANIQSAAFYTNVADTRTDGIELTGNYQWDLQQWGRLNLSSGFAKTNTTITGLRDVGSIKGSQIVGRNTQGLIEDGTPDTKLTLSANWLYENWGVNIAQRRYGEWKSLNATNPNLDQTFSPQWVTDVDLSYTFHKGVKVSVGAINLFDTHPDKADGAQLYGVPKYSITSPEGAQGAFYYTSISYDF